MKGDNPFIGMTPKELNDYLDDLSKEKPGKDDSSMMSDFLFNRNKPAGQRFSMNGQPGSGKAGHRCSVCDTFYFESENMIGNDGICKSCWQDLKELEDDCPDEDKEIEIIHKHEKNSKSF